MTIDSTTSDDGEPPLRLVVITGMSGAGHTSALRVLEDMGYEAIDNLPLSMLPAVVRKQGRQPIAVGIDSRTRNFAVADLARELDQLKRDASVNAALVFIDCDDEVLGRRYSETRRRHPLAIDRPVADGIRHERHLVSPLKKRADVVIDTSNLQARDLRRLLTGHLGDVTTAGMSVFVTSFAYHAGIPREADLVFDVRFLRNPYYEEHLRVLPGTDSRVGEYVREDQDYEMFMSSVTGMLQRLLPRYVGEGKSYFTVAIGCTGGRHRSVTVAEQLAAWLREFDCPVTLDHRDVDRWQP